jgi:hypothetical protein
MAAKLTRLTHKIAIQLHLVVESCTICSSRSRPPVRKLLDTPSYVTGVHLGWVKHHALIEIWAVVMNLKENSSEFIYHQHLFQEFLYSNLVASDDV